MHLEYEAELDSKDEGNFIEVGKDEVDISHTSTDSELRERE